MYYLHTPASGRGPQGQLTPLRIRAKINTHGLSCTTPTRANSGPTAGWALGFASRPSGQRTKGRAKPLLDSHARRQAVHAREERVPAGVKVDERARVGAAGLAREQHVALPSASAHVSGRACIPNAALGPGTSPHVQGQADALATSCSVRCQRERLQVTRVFARKQGCLDCNGAHLLVERNLLQEGAGGLGQVGGARAEGRRPAKLQVVDEAVAEDAPGVELALQALHVGREADEVDVGEVLLGGDGRCPKKTRLASRSGFGARHCGRG